MRQGVHLPEALTSGSLNRQQLGNSILPSTLKPHCSPASVHWYGEVCADNACAVGLGEPNPTRSPISGSASGRSGSLMAVRGNERRLDFRRDRYLSTVGARQSGTRLIRESGRNGFEAHGSIFALDIERHLAAAAEDGLGCPVFSW